jgi:ABC-2 type transport system permease protein
MDIRKEEVTMGSLLWYELRSRWEVILGWGLGLGGFGALYTSVYPQVAEQMGAFADLPFSQIMGLSLITYEGYLASTVINYLSILLGIYAITAGTGTLAGEEESGTLELLVTTRLARWQLVTAKAIALMVVVFLVLVLGGFGSMLAFNAVADQVETTITGVHVFMGVLYALPVVVALLMLALFTGAFLPSRRIALMVMTLIFVVSYFGKNVAGMVETLEWLKPLSLFTYQSTDPAIFTAGPAIGDVAVLAGVSLGFFLMALWSFDRRDLTVGRIRWQRA